MEQETYTKLQVDRIGLQMYTENVTVSAYILLLIVDKISIRKKLHRLIWYSYYRRQLFILITDNN